MIDSLSVAGSDVKPYSEWRAWYAMFTFLVQALVAGIDVAIVTLLVHPIESAFHINDVTFATMTTVSIALGGTIAYYPSGLLADTFRRREIVLVGSAIWTLAAVWAARSDSQAMFFIARLIAGVGVGMSAPAIFSMITDAFPRKRRGFALGAYSVGLAIGGSVGLTTCWKLVDWTQHRGIVHVGNISLVPWQQCFILSAVLGLISLLLLLTITEPGRTERVAQTGTNLTSTLRVFGQYMRHHWFLWTMIFIGYQFGGTICFALSTWAPAFGLRHYHAGGVGDITLLGTVGAAGGLIGSISGGIIGQHVVNRANPGLVPRMLTTIQALSCVFAAGFPFMPSWLLANVGMAGVWVTAAMMGVFIQVGIQETAPNEARGQLTALNAFMAFIPQMIGATTVASLASSIFAKAGGLGPALAAVGAVSSVLGIFAFALAHRPYERAHAEMRTLVSISPPA